MGLRLRTRTTKKGKKLFYIIHSYTLDGKEIQSPGIPLGAITRRQAKDELERYKMKVSNPTQVPVVKRTFKSVADEFLNLYKPRVKPRMVILFNWAMGHISKIDESDIKNVTTLDLQRILNKMYLSPLSGRTLNILGTQIRKVFGYAKKMKYTHEMPDIPRFDEKVGNRKTPRLSDSEIRLLRHHCDRDEKFLLLFMLSTGLRAQEFTALAPEDIDLNNHTIRIVSEDKLKAGRFLPLTKYSIRILKVCWGDIIRRGRVSPWETTSGAYHALKKVSKENKLDIAVNLKALRKTALSRLAEKGMNRVAHMRISGHRDYRTTDKYYIETDLDFLRSEMNRVG